MKCMNWNPFKHLRIHHYLSVFTLLRIQRAIFAFVCQKKGSYHRHYHIYTEFSRYTHKTAMQMLLFYKLLIFFLFLVFFAVLSLFRVYSMRYIFDHKKTVKRTSLISGDVVISVNSTHRLCVYFSGFCAPTEEFGMCWCLWCLSEFRLDLLRTK